MDDTAPKQETPPDPNLVVYEHGFTKELEICQEKLEVRLSRTIWKIRVTEQKNG